MRRLLVQSRQHKSRFVALVAGSALLASTFVAIDSTASRATTILSGDYGCTLDVSVQAGAEDGATETGWSVQLATSSGGVTTCVFKATGERSHFRVPAKVQTIAYIVAGGGGGGGNERGGGGGAGGVANSSFRATPGNDYSVVVARGGAGGGSGSQTGSAGNGGWLVPSASIFGSGSFAHVGGGGGGGAFGVSGAGGNGTGSSGGGGGANFNGHYAAGGANNGTGGFAGAPSMGSAASPSDSPRNGGGGGGAGSMGVTGGTGVTTEKPLGNTPDGGAGVTGVVYSFSVALAGGGGAANGSTEPNSECTYKSAGAGLGGSVGSTRVGGNGEKMAGQGTCSDVANWASSQSFTDGAANTGSGGGGGVHATAGRGADGVAYIGYQIKDENITATNLTATYNEGAPVAVTPGFTISPALASGDSVTVSYSYSSDGSDPATATYSGTSPPDALGRYFVIPSSAVLSTTNGNSYNFSYTAGTLTVSAASLAAPSITVANTSGALKSLSVSWPHVANASTYSVDVLDSNGVKRYSHPAVTDAANMSVTITSTNFTDLADGTDYKVVVTANPAANDKNHLATASAQATIHTNSQLTYSANGGTGSGPGLAISNTNVTVATNTFVHTGYTFVGWNTKSDASGVWYAAASTINLQSNTTLYAQWIGPIGTPGITATVGSNNKQTFTGLSSDVRDVYLTQGQTLVIGTSGTLVPGATQTCSIRKGGSSVSSVCSDLILSSLTSANSGDIYDVSMTQTLNGQTSTPENVTPKVRLNVAPTLSLGSQPSKNATVDVTDFSYTVTGLTGGRSGYTYTATGLPTGMSISTSGVITGTPSVANTFNATITVADANGATATSTISIVVAKGTQGAITLSLSPSSGAYNGTAYTATPTFTVTGARSTTAPTYTVAGGPTSPATNCQISGSTITASTTGVCRVTVSVAGDSNWANTVTATADFTFTVATQGTFTFTLTSSSATYTGSAFTATPGYVVNGGTGTGTVSYTVADGTAIGCVLSGLGNTTLTASTSGTCVITATRAGDANFAAATATQTFTFDKATQSTPTAPTITARAADRLTVNLSGFASNYITINLYTSSSGGTAAQTFSSYFQSGSTGSYDFNGLSAGTQYWVAVVAGSSTEYFASAESARATTYLPAQLSLAVGSNSANNLTADVAAGSEITYTPGQILTFSTTTTWANEYFLQYRVDAADWETNGGWTNVNAFASTTPSFTFDTTGLTMTRYWRILPRNNGSAGAPTFVAITKSTRSLTFRTGVTWNGVVGTTFSRDAQDLVIPNLEKRPLTFAVVGSMPAGLTLSSSGAVSGTPTTPGVYSVSIDVTDGNGFTGATQTLTISIAATQTITWTTITAKTLGSGTVDVSSLVSASSGLTVSLTSSTTGVCTVSGFTVTLVHAGTCTLAADQAGNSSFSAAPQASTSFTVNKAKLAQPSTPSASATSGTLKSITVSWTAVTNASGYIVTLYNSAGTTAHKTMNVASGTSRVITTADYSSMQDNTIYKVSVIASGDAIDYVNSDESAKASVTTNAAPATPTGTALTSLYGKTVSQTISFSTSGSTTDAGVLSYQWKKDGVDIAGATSSTYSFTIAATTDAGSYSVVITNTLNGSTASTTLTAATLTVASAPSITTPSNQSLTVGVSYSLNISASGGSTSRTYSVASGPLPDGLSLNTGSGAITGTPTAAGTFTVTIQVADVNNVTATTSSFTMTVAKGSQSGLSFTLSPTSASYANGAYSAVVTYSNVTGGSGSGAVTYAIASSGSTATGCALSSDASGATLTATTAGTCVIQATKAADANYNAITTLRSFTFGVSTQTITWTTLPNLAYGSSPVNLTSYVSTSSGLAVTIGSNNQSICTMSSNVVTLVNVGTCSLTAYQAGNSNYSAATNANASFTITAAQLAKPTAPTVTASASKLKSLNVSWTAISNAASYTLKLYDSGSTLLKTITGVSGTGRTIDTTDYASFADNTSYKVSVTAVGNGTTYSDSSESDLVSQTTNPGPVTPSATALTSISKTVGQTASFTTSGSTTDGGAITYQWRKNAVNISGATSATYSFTISATTDAADYSVVVTNTLNGGTATTTVTATLTVASTLAITAPSNRSGTFQTALTGFKPTTTGGKTPLTFALNGSLITGLTFDTTDGTISGTPTVVDTQSYTITVTDANGQTATSASFSITIAKKTLSAPTGVTLVPTTNTALSLTAGWTAASLATSYTVTLYRFGSTTTVLATVTGVTGTSTVIDASIYSSISSSESYEVAVRALGDTNTTNNSGLTYSTGWVNPLAQAVSPVISMVSTITRNIGQTLTYTPGATVTDSGTLSYQWQKDGVDISGATSLTLTQVVASSSDAGVYKLIVTNTKNNSTTTANASFTLSLNPALAVSVPSSLSVYKNQTGFTITLTGSGGKSGTSKTWALTTGPLPTGMSFNTSTAVISGTPTAAGSYPVTISYTDTRVSSTDATVTDVISVTFTIDVLDTTTLSTPTNVVVNATPNTTRSIQVSWDAVDHADSYAVYLYSSAGTLQCTVTTTNTTVTLNDTNCSSTLSSAQMTTAKTFKVDVKAVSATSAYVTSGLSTRYDVTTNTQVGDVTLNNLSSSLALTIGQTKSITATATGNGTLSYVWKQGTTVVGTNSPTLSLTGSSSGMGSNGSTYTVTVTNTINGESKTATSNTVTISTSSAPTLTASTFSAPYGAAITEQTLSNKSCAATPCRYSIGSGSLPTGLSLNTNLGSISGTPTALGTFNYTILATDNNGFAVESAGATITVGQGTQTALSLSWTPFNGSWNGTAYSTATTFTVSGGSGTGAVSYSIADGTATGCALNSTSTPTNVSTTTSGTCSITATKQGDTNYSNTVSISSTYTMGTGAQTITFTTPNDVVFGTPTSLVGFASSSSGLTPTYSSDTTAVCTVTGTTLNINRVGVCTLRASQSGDSRWSTATPVTATFNITARPITVTSGTYSKAFGATDPASFYSVSNLAGSDAYGSVVITFAGINGTTYGPSTTRPTAKGEYSVTPSGGSFSTGTSTNYTVSYATAGTYTIGSAALTTPSAPTVTATTGKYNALNVSWTAITGASSYTLKLYDTNGTTLLTTITGATGTSRSIDANDYALTGSHTYKVSITAIGDGTNYLDSQPSATLGSATTNAAANSPTVSFTGMQTRTAGQALTLTSSVSGNNGTLTYKWYRGATQVGSSANLTLTGITSADAGDYTVEVTNTFNGSTTVTTSSAATLTVSSALTISTPANATATVGSALNAIVPSVTGGKTPLVFSLAGTLIAGLTFDTTDGSIRGTPTAVGTASYTITVTDANSSSAATGSFSITVSTVTLSNPTNVVLAKTTGLEKSLTLTWTAVASANNHTVTLYNSNVCSGTKFGTVDTSSTSIVLDSTNITFGGSGTWADGASYCATVVAKNTDTTTYTSSAATSSSSVTTNAVYTGNKPNLNGLRGVKSVIVVPNLSYNSLFEYIVSATVGSASYSSSTNRITVTGLADGQSTTVTLLWRRAGYIDNSMTATQTARQPLSWTTNPGTSNVGKTYTPAVQVQSSYSTPVISIDATSDPGVCSTNGTVVTFAALGNCVISTYQPENVAYYFAISETITQTIQVVVGQVGTVTTLSLAANTGITKSLKATWGAVTSATGYTLKLYDSSTNTLLATISNVSGTTRTIDVTDYSGMQNSYAYKFTVTALGDGGTTYSDAAESAKSLAATTVAGPATPTLSGLSAVAKTAGQSTTFTVTVSGTGAGALSYQWFKGTTAISGATSASLVLSNLTSADAGDYKVTVTNTLNAATASATTTPVTLTVSDALVFNAPTGLSATVGSLYSLNLGDFISGGAPTLTYSMTGTLPSGLSRSGNSILGTVTSSVGATALTFTVTDANGATASRTFTISVAAAQLGTPQSVAAVNKSNTLKTILVSWLSVTHASGYILKLYNSAGTSLLKTITGISGTSYTVDATDYSSLADSTTYQIAVIASGDAVDYSNSAESSPATVTTLDGPTAPTVSIGGMQSRTPGQTLSLTSTVGSYNGSISYKWYRGTTLVGTSSSLTINSVTSADAGDYTLEVTNTYNGATSATTSSVATLAVASTLTISTPSNATGTVGSAITAIVPTSTGGLSPITYSLTGTLITGLSFDTTDGSIRGTPTAVGTANFTITATDANGATATTGSFSITISAATLSTPSSVVLSKVTGSNTSLTVSFTGDANAASYLVKVYSNVGLTTQVGSNWTSFTTGSTNTITGLTANTNYWVTVQSIGNSNYTSSTVSAAATQKTNSTFAVHFDTQGSNVIADRTFTTGTALGGTDPTPASRSGFSFLGWSTSTDGLTTSPSTYIAYTTGDVTFYAQWVAIPTDTSLSVTVNPVGTTSQVTTGSPATLYLTAGQSFTATVNITAPSGTTLGSKWSFWNGSTWSTPVSGTSTTVSNVTTSMNGYRYQGLVKYVKTAGNSTEISTIILQLSVSQAMSINSIGNLVATRGVAYSYTPTRLGGRSGYTYSLNGSLPDGLTFDATDGSISGTATTVTSALSRTLTVTDANGATATQTLTIEVSGATLTTPSSPTVTATANTLKSIDVSWSSVSNASTYTVKIYDALGTTQLRSINVLSGTSLTITATNFPAIADATGYRVTVYARGDGTNYTDSLESSKVSVTTNAAAATPSVTITGSQSRTPGQSLTLTSTVTGNGSGTLTYKWFRGSTQVATTADLTINSVTSADAGDYTVEVTNSLNGSTAAATSTASTLTVAAVLAFGTPTGSLTANVGDSYSLDVSTGITGGRSPFSYAVTSGSLPSTLTLSGSTISGTPTATGTYAITVTATDANGAIITSSFTITVAAATVLAPSVGNLTNLNKTVGQTAIFSTTGTTTDGGTISYQWQKNGVDIAGETGSSLTISVGSGLVGTNTYKVIVTNTRFGQTATTEKTATLTVASALAINTPAATNGHVGVALSVTTGATGGATPLTYSLTGTLIAGLTFDTTDGSISGTPTATGNVDYTVTATDANSATVSTSSFNITVLARVQLAQPSTFTLTRYAAGDYRVQVYFSAVSNASSYIVRVYDASTGGNVVQTINNFSAGINNVVTGLSSATEYWFTVEAVGANQYDNSAETARSLMKTALRVNTITFNALANKTYGAADFNLGATATSSLSVTYATVGTGSCTISGSTVHITSAGTCTIRASQSGDATWAPASSVDQTFTVAKAALTITGATISKVYRGASGTLWTTGTLVTGDAVDAVVVRYVGTGSTTYASSTTAPTAIGTYAIVLSGATGLQAASAVALADNYDVSYVDGSLTITQLQLTTPTLRSLNPVSGSNTSLAVQLNADSDASSYLAKVYSNVGLTNQVGSDWTSFTPAADGIITGLTANTRYWVTVQVIGSGNFSSSAVSAALNASTSSSWTLSWDTQGGSTIADGTFSTGSAITPPTDPTYSGYTFVGWYESASSGTKINFGTYAPTATANLTLYAHWVATPNSRQVDVSLTFGGTYGTAPNSSTATLNLTATEGATLTVHYTAPTGSTRGVTWWKQTSGSSTWTQVGSSAALTLSNVPATDNGDKYRAEITNTLDGVTSPVYYSTTFTLAVAAAFSIDAIANQSANVDSPFSLTATVTGGRSGYTFALYGGSTLPAGLTLNTSTGVISGTPTAAGTSAIRIRAVDSNGASSISSSFNIVVAAGTQSGITLTVSPTSQSLTNNFSASITVGVSGGNGTGAVTYSIESTGTTATGCQLDSTSAPTTLTASSAGICVIKASKAGDSNFGNTVTSTVNFTIGNKSATVTSGTYTKVYGGSDPSMVPTASGLLTGDAVGSATLTFEGTGSTSYSASTTMPTAAGTYSVTPSAVVLSSGATSNYTFSYVAGTLTITATTQTVSFPTISGKTYGSGTFTASATATSGLTVTFASTTTAVCTVSGTTVTIVKAGTCTLTADQAGNGNYNAATQVSQSITISKAVLTATASSHTVAFGASTPTITVTYSNFANSDNANSSSFTTGLAAPTCATTYTSSASAGSSVATVCSGGSSTNYTFSFVDGTISVGQTQLATPNSITFSTTNSRGLKKTLAFTWNATANATSYTLKLYNSTGTNLLATVTGVTTTSYSFTTSDYSGMADDTSYKASLTAVGSSNFADSAESAKETGRTMQVYVITYSGNGADSGSAPADDEVIEGSLGPVVANNTGNFTKLGYTMTGWNTQAGLAGNSYVFGTRYTIFQSVTLHALWVADSLMVTYKSNGGGQSDRTQNITAGTAFTLTTNNFTRTGYTFGGWSNTNNGSRDYTDGQSVTLLTAKTLYAIWTPIDYTVTYALNGGGGTAPTESAKNIGQSFTIPANPSRTGYTFNGWTDGTDILNAGDTYTVGSQNITLTAQWNVETYVITYSRNNGSSGSASRTSDTLQYGAQPITLPTVGNMVKSGHTFAGWSLTINGSVLTGNYTATQSRTLYAIWTPNTYVITYNTNGADSGSPTRTNENYTFNSSGQALPAVGTMVKAGYQFAGWSDTVGGTSPLSSTGSSTASDRTLYAIWTAISYRVIYDVSVGTSATPTEANHVINDTFTLAAAPTPPTSNTPGVSYAFAGWDDGTSQYPAGATYTMAANDVTFVAKYVFVYMVHYILNGSPDQPELDVQRISGYRGVTAAAPERLGYTFTNWTDQAGATYAPFASYTVDADTYILTAQWTAIPIHVTYDLDGGTASPLPTEADHIIGESFTVKAAPTRTGYTFAGWQSGAQLYGAGATYIVGADDITFTAQWTAIVYRVTYDLNLGTSVTPVQANRNYQQTFVVAAAPTRRGYTFVNWSDGTNTYNPGATYTVATSNVVLTAQWSITTLTVTYNQGAGNANPGPVSSLPTEGNHVIGDTFALAAEPVWPTHDFLGWSDGATLYAAGATYLMLGEDVTLTAAWANTQYALTFDAGGAQGAPPALQNLAVGDTITLPGAGNMGLAGYSFAGWSTGITTYRAGASFSMPAAAVRLTALWNIVVTQPTNNVGGGGSSASIIAKKIPTGLNFGTGTQLLQAVSSLGSPITWSTNSPGCSVSETGALTVTGAGKCSVTATDTVNPAVTSTYVIPVAPKLDLSLLAVTNLQSTSATLNAQVAWPGASFSVKFCITDSPTSTNCVITSTITIANENSGGASANNAVTIAREVTGLQANTQYFVHAAIIVGEDQFSTAAALLRTPLNGAPTFGPVKSGVAKFSWIDLVNGASATILVDGKVVCKNAAGTCQAKLWVGPKSLAQVVFTNKDGEASLPINLVYSRSRFALPIVTVKFAPKRQVLTQAQRDLINSIALKVNALGYANIQVASPTTKVTKNYLEAKRIGAVYEFLKRYFKNEKRVKLTLIRTRAKESYIQNGKDVPAGNRRVTVAVR